MKNELSIALVEDEDFFVEQINDFLKRYSAEHDLSYKVTHFRSGQEFLFQYRPIYDLIFMDVMMPGLNGIETATELRKLDSLATLVFCTNYASFAVKGYEVDAFDFLVKPIVYENFVSKMNRILKMLSTKEKGKIVLKISGKEMVFSIDEIHYIEVRNHNIFIVTDNGEFTCRGSLNEYEGNLKEKGFSRPSAGFLVNLRFVSQADADFCLVKGKKIPLGRSKKKAFLLDLTNYLGKAF